MRLYRYSDPEPTTICSGGDGEAPQAVQGAGDGLPQLRDPAVGHGDAGDLDHAGTVPAASAWPRQRRERALCSRRLPAYSSSRAAPGAGASVRMGGGDGGRRAGSSWGDEIAALFPGNDVSLRSQLSIGALHRDSTDLQVLRKAPPGGEPAPGRSGGRRGCHSGCSGRG